MRDVFFLLFELLSTLVKLARPGGSRTVIAENLLLKQQLIIHSRSRQRAPNLSTRDRTLLGFMSLFLPPRRIVRAAIIIKPSTLLSFHSALKKRKYRLLYSPRGGKKPGPKGPSREVIDAIVEMKQRNPRYGCPRIAQQINLAFGLDLDKDTVRRILATHYKPDPGNRGPSWLTTLGSRKGQPVEPGRRTDRPVPRRIDNLEDPLDHGSHGSVHPQDYWLRCKRRKCGWSCTMSNVQRCHF